MIVLGIETSCDETAVAVVRDARPRIVASRLYAQESEHRPFGGVVPEIAARAHVERLDGLIAQTMAKAKLDFAALDGIAATAGPGLIGGVMVGLVTAKAIAAVHRKPLIALNHLEAHALTARLTDDVAFPYLLLLVSGGHCQLLVVQAVGRYRRLGTTIDDAAGEAFDKTAKLLGLGYPGGPAVERRAVHGDGARFDLPRPLVGTAGCDFSFSGLKTAVARLAKGLGARDCDDLCASFQSAVADVLCDRTGRAMAAFRHGDGAPARPSFVIAGGVAANQYLRTRLTALAHARGFELIAPPPALCTDNGAMVAWAGLERLRLGLTDPLDFSPHPRWPLDPAAKPAPFAGVKA
jgi:N6-L-threonylcarbamoyladenine synthase